MNPLTPTRLNHRWPIYRLSIGLLALVIAMSVVSSVVEKPAVDNKVVGAAASTTRPEAQIVGYGWGHGRGMGQYGALGYARDFGWGSDAILDHFYSNTTSGPASLSTIDPDRVRVELVSMAGRYTRIALEEGRIEVLGEDGSMLHTIGRGAVRLVASSGDITIAYGESCAGPWTDLSTVDDQYVRVRASSQSQGPSGLLEVCGRSSSTWYDGDVLATYSGGEQHSVNVVSVEQYLRGVVPNEVPASWPAAALEAQAVAARSYVLAGDTRFASFADTCDTTLCQVYDGRFTNRGGMRSATAESTDAAIATTAGQVRVFDNGTIARTEFSSSTGGYTVDGDFPAVVDEGDGVADNPNSTWMVTVDLRGVESKYGLGDLVSMEVTARDGNGADGGRVETVQYQFESGAVEVTGNDVRRELGLRSDWFTLVSVYGGATGFDSADDAKSSMGGVADAFITTSYQRFLQRDPSVDELAEWRSLVDDRESREAMVSSLAGSNEFAGPLVDDFYRMAMQRRPDSSGRSYWIDQMVSGTRHEEIGLHFYGSDEYFIKSGETNDAFVGSLYRNILWREAEAEGRRYWVEALDSGTPRIVVVSSFYLSIESRRRRAAVMYERVAGSQPSAEQRENLAGRLLNIDDLGLAVEIAVDDGWKQAVESNQ